MLEIFGTDGWRAAHAGAVIGLLEIAGLDNTLVSPQLEARKRQLELRLRSNYAGFSRAQFLALPVISVYEKYYRRFDKTYHVLLQLESIVLKGKDLPQVSPLVDANFIAEIDTWVLTAGHDADKLVEPVTIDVSLAADTITQMNGNIKSIRAGDMVMRDAHGISCSILYGQDDRSQITAETSRVLYVAYAPPGVSAQAVEAQLAYIEQNVRLFSPSPRVEQSRLLLA